MEQLPYPRHDKIDDGRDIAHAENVRLGANKVKQETVASPAVPPGCSVQVAPQ